MTLTVPFANDQYSLRIPAHRFRQGPRDVYSFALDLPTVDGLLPQRVDEDVVKDANRRLTISHARNIQAYLSDRPDWLLGALLLGIAPDALEFEPYKDDAGNASEGFGELRILTNRINTLRIFDGQHRRRAIADALSGLENGDGNSRQLAALQRSSLPIVLYAEQDMRALRQMFADASRTKPIEANTVTRFDKRGAFNLAAVWLAENSELFEGRVEMERTTVPQGSQCLISINQMAKVLRILELGFNSRVSKDRNEELMQSLDALHERCLAWADGFMPAARQEFNGLLTGDIANEEIPRLRPATFAYNATVIQVITGCLHQWRREKRSEAALAQFFSGASLDRRNNAESLPVKSGLVTANGFLTGNYPSIMRAINYIVREAANAAN